MLSAQTANRRYFRRAYRTGRHGWATQQPSPHAMAFLRRLRRAIPGGRLLDVGCGEGRHAIAAAKLGFRVVAIDYEPLALRRARRFAKAGNVRGVAFRLADILRAAFADPRFDVVLDYGCLHHQRKSAWPAYRAAVLRALKPGGFYVLSVFSPGFHLFRGRNRPWHIAQGAYRRCFTKQPIRRLAGRELEVMALTEEKGSGRGFWHALMRRRAKPAGHVARARGPRISESAARTPRGSRRGSSSSRASCTPGRAAAPPRCRTVRRSAAGR